MPSSSQAKVALHAHWLLLNPLQQVREMGSAGLPVSKHSRTNVHVFNTYVSMYCKRALRSVAGGASG